MIDRAVLLLSFGIAFVLAAALPTRAQEAPLVAQAARPGIEEIVVTARKTAENLQDIPVAVTAFTSDTLRDTGTKEVFDLQYQTPNLTINQHFSSASAAKIQMRGQSQADVLLTTDSSVGVYIDGVNMPRTLGIRGNMFDLERVEVVKGPQGTLYGRNTTGGAINLISRKPSYEGLGGFVEAGLGNFDAFRFAGAINVPLIEQKVALRVAAQRSVRDGFGMSSFTGKELADDDEWFVRTGLQINPVERLGITLTGDYQKVDERGSIVFPTVYSTNVVPGQPIFNTALATGVELGVIDLANPATIATGLPIALQALNAQIGGRFYENQAGGQDFFPDAEADMNRFEGWGVGVNGTLDLEAFSITSITGYRYFKRHGTPDLDGTPFQILHPNLNAKLDFWSQEVWFNGSAFDARLDWLVGGYYSNEDGVDGSRTLALAAINPARPSILDGDVENSSWALFTQSTFEIVGGLRATAGVRYTEERKELVSRNRSGGIVTPEACSLPPGGVPISQCSRKFAGTFDGWSYLFGLDYHVTEEALTYVKYSQGFRGGGQNLRGGRDPTSFQSYKPEFARELEIGMKGDFLDRRLRVNAAGFWTKYEDIQRSVIVPGAGLNIVTVLTNAAEATIFGVELETTIEPIEGLLLTSTVGWLDPKYDEFIDTDPATLQPIDRSDDPFGVPKWETSLRARYQREIGRGSASASVNWTWQDDVNRINSVGITDPTFPASTVNTKSYSLVNTRIAYELTDSRVEFAIYANNLFDEKYVPGIQDLSTLGYLVKAAGDPRTFGFEIRKAFGAE